MKKMSYGEEEIAKILEEEKIEYEYEYPISIMEEKEGDTQKLRIWYPDFWLPRYSIVIEYFGLKGNENYDKGTVDKIKAYKKLHIDYIPVYPSTIKKNLRAYIVKSIITKINNNIKHFKTRKS
ncbi:MAG TPA: hypothetical protein VEC16_05935 [Alphaproteobacteria bacterium]|nr:hypothetical protein [Alphaproteobacteria bacterium]